MVSKQIQKGSIVTFMKFRWTQTETNSWLGVNGGSVGDLGESSELILSLATGDTVFYLDDKPDVNPSWGVPHPLYASFSIVHENGSMQLPMGSLTATDADAWLKLVHEAQNGNYTLKEAKNHCSIKADQ